MNVLVTGANGFVGRALVQGLVDRNFDSIVAMLRRSDVGLPKNIHQVLVNDITKVSEYGNILSDIDIVIHAAARVHIMKDDARDPLNEFRRVNVEGTLQLAKKAALCGIKRFVFISTIKVNGEETKKNAPFRTEDIPMPKDPYGISKYEAEEALQSLAVETGMEVVIIRPTLVYGPGVKGNFRSMLSLVSKGIPLPLGAIDNLRSLVALENLVDLIITCACHPKAANKVFLAGDGVDLSTADLLKKVGISLGRPARLLPVPVPLITFTALLLGKRAVARRLLGSLIVDLSSARDILGWRPPVSMEDELKRTAKEFLNGK